MENIWINILICFGTIVLLFIIAYYFYSQIHEQNKNIELPPWIAESRQTTLNRIINLILAQYACSPDECALQIQPLDSNRDMVELLFDNFSYQLYCDWQKEKITMRYSFHDVALESHFISNQCTFKAHQHFFNFCAIEEKIRDWYFEWTRKIYKNDEQLFISCVAAAKELADSEKSTEDFERMLLQTWDNINFSEKTEQRDIDAANFTRLTAYILHNYPNKLEEYLQRTIKK